MKTRARGFFLGVIGAGLTMGCAESDPAGDQSGVGGEPVGGAFPSAGAGGGGTTSTGGVAGTQVSGGGTTSSGGVASGPATGGVASGGFSGVGGSSVGGAGQGNGGGGSGGGETVSPSDAECFRLTARSSASGEKYSVPTTPDLYQCFNYALPWGNEKVQVVSARPLIDNSQVIHHWILYNTTSAVTDGSNGACSHPGATFIVGWAPGGQPMEMPSDVGLEVGGAGFSLEVHYNNTAGAGQLDASGVELCVTENLRPKVAAVHWLGTANLNKLVATGTCTPANTMPVTIMGSSPHMHLQGRHMKTVINRKAGGTEVLIDQPFDFNTQVSYPTPATIYPGDTLTTTCTFATPTPFGEGTNEEMCFNFVTAYPAGQLVNAFGLQPNDCTSF